MMVTESLENLLACIFSQETAVRRMEPGPQLRGTAASSLGLGHGCQRGLALASLCCRWLFDSCFDYPPASQSHAGA